jgi:uncharacterized protein (TIGR02118 family)
LEAEHLERRVQHRIERDGRWTTGQPGTALPAVAFAMRWTLAGGVPLKGTTPYIAGTIDLEVFHDEDGLSAMVDPRALRIVAGDGTQVALERFGTSMTMVPAVHSLTSQHGRPFPGLCRCRGHANSASIGSCPFGRGIGELPMAQVIALYKKPADPAAFDAYYHGTHVPIAKTLPGLRSYRISSGAVAGGAGETGLHLVALLEFDSMAAIQTALGSPQGAATAADLANFAQAGVELLMFDTREI